MVSSSLSVAYHAFWRLGSDAAVHWVTELSLLPLVQPPWPPNLGGRRKWEIWGHPRPRQHPAASRYLSWSTSLDPPILGERENAEGLSPSACPVVGSAEAGFEPATNRVIPAKAGIQM